MIKILIADDQECVREGIAALLSYHQDLQIVGQASNGEEACKLAKELSPDVVLMDIRMPVCDGIAATQTIISENPNIKVLVLTTFDEEDLVIKAIKSGASGYLLKDTKSDRIAAAIHTVRDGGMVLSPTAATKVVSHLDAPRQAGDGSRRLELENKLSERKIAVLKLIGQGKSNTEIAETLHITEGTVKNYVSQIFDELGVRDRVQAALIAQQELL
jgi:DNA-binding NarL/FixJ family response regulator